MLELADKDSSFVVANYHMPCKFMVNL